MHESEGVVSAPGGDRVDSRRDKTALQFAGDLFEGQPGNLRGFHPAVGRLPAERSLLKNAEHYGEQHGQDRHGGKDLGQREREDGGARPHQYPRRTSVTKLRLCRIGLLVLVSRAFSGQRSRRW